MLDNFWQNQPIFWWSVKQINVPRLYLSGLASFLPVINYAVCSRFISNYDNRFDSIIFTGIRIGKVKVQLFWEGHKKFEKIPHLFWGYWVKTAVLSKQVGYFFSNFVGFS